MPKSNLSTIALCNPKSPTNVGAVMRAAGCYQASEVRYSGDRYDRAVKFQTDTKNYKETIPLLAKEDLIEGLAPDIEIVCVDFAVGATALPKFVHPKRAMYVFGPEDGSIPQELVDKAQHVVYVPTVGCMNLAASVNVVLYDRMAKSEQDIDDTATILANRDNKNRLTVNR